jgi:hypothetical protein
VVLLGLVDSGADRTILPKLFAAVLGISHTELMEDEIGGSGVGGRKFPTWSSVIPIFGQVVLGSGELWGPVFRLNPAFAEVDAFLWGRADFFRKFKITFEEGPAPEFLIEF